MCKNKIIKIYEKYIEEDAEKILDELVDKSEIYKFFVKPRKIIKENREDYEHYFQGLKDLKHIGARPSRAFLLYLFSEHSDKKRLLEKSIDFLVKYFVRRSLTDYPGTRKLDTIFINLIDECQEYSEDLDIKNIIEFLGDETRFTSLENFKEKLNGNIYEINRDATRFILTSIEEHNQPKKERRNFWEWKSEKLIWTIEHILPQKENLPDHWIDEIASGDEEKAREIQENYTHKLGNLTLTGYNANLGTKSFLEKRDIKDKNGNYNGFKNGLYLNRNLKEKKKWTKDDIQNRTNELVKIAIDLFKVEEIDKGIS